MRFSHRHVIPRQNERPEILRHAGHSDDVHLAPGVIHSCCSTDFTVWDHELALHSGTKSPHPRRADPVIIPSAIPKPAGKYKGKPAHANPASSVRDEVKNLSVSPDEHGLPPWGQLKVLDKYLWILEAAHLKGLDALTSAEISHLIFAVFRENQGTNKVKNLKTRIKATHVRLAKIQQTTGDLQGWQILKGGKDHLKNLVAAGAAKS